jgi:hypothetical protein
VSDSNFRSVGRAPPPRCGGTPRRPPCRSCCLRRAASSRLLRWRSGRLVSRESERAGLQRRRRSGRWAPEQTVRDRERRRWAPVSDFLSEGARESDSNRFKGVVDGRRCWIFGREEQGRRIPVGGGGHDVLIAFFC